MSGHFLSAALRKRELREHYKELRRTLEPEDKRRMDGQLLERLLELPEYREAELVLCYVSMAREPDTFGLMRAAWKDGKRVAVPRMSGRAQMEFYEITSHRALVPHSFGVMEPDPQRSVLLQDPKGATCFVPGLAFDRGGYRIGYGGGYYDRFLDSFEGPTVGLCYERCLADELVREDHDAHCGLVVSEERVLRVGDKEQAPA